MVNKRGYRIHKDDIPTRSVVPMAGHPDAIAAGIKLNTQKCFGTEASVMFANRDEGYHTTPHIHDCEQYNIILSGYIWFFIEDEGWKCGPGDIMRIPRNKLHWAWNRGPGIASLIEVHSPPLTGNPGMLDHAVGLLTEGEDAEAINHTKNQRVDYDPMEIDVIEKRAIEKEESAPTKNRIS